MSSRKQGSQPRGLRSAEDNFKKSTRRNMKRSKMKGASSEKKRAGPQQKNLEPALPGSWGRCSAERPPSGSVRNTRTNEQKTPENGDSGGTSEPPQPSQKKRTRADCAGENKEALKNKMEVKVEIPEELNPWLVEDWDLVTNQKQLFQLPAKKNADAILEEYANCKKSQGSHDNEEYAVNEVVGGIKEYFNVMLGTQLLYKFEKPQYAEILAAHPDALMSQLYGAPHLLRLFVRTREMLASTLFNKKSLVLLYSSLHDFLKYLAKNAATLFTTSDYKVASAEYQCKAL